MEQLNFPSDQLGKHLRCSDCRNLLSVPPVIVLKDTGKYKCGRCCLAGEDGTGKNFWPVRIRPKTLVYEAAVTVRDLPYEGLAKDLLFPCKNLKYGCSYYHTFLPLGDDWLNDIHDIYCSYTYSINCPCKDVRYSQISYSSYIKHLQSEHREQSCEKKWHSHVVTIAKNSDGDNERMFCSPDNKVIFFLLVVKTGREFTFSVRSVGTEQLFQFEIKPGKFRNNNKSKRGETLLSHTSFTAVSRPSVKLVLMREDDDNKEVKQYEFQLDFVGKVKPEELVKVPVKDSDVLRCTKCAKYLSVKPVVAIKNGFECGRCFTKTEGDKVRLKGYEMLAEMLMFPCEEPGCGKSFGIGEMKKHWNAHRLSVSKNVCAKKKSNVRETGCKFSNTK